MPRFAILEHTGAPDDPAGVHHDLLLEHGPHCRTWRLASVPEPDGPAVTAVELAPHRLAWLDHAAGDVSGGRGFARRFDAGTYEQAAGIAGDPARPGDVDAVLRGGRIVGRLLLREHAGGWVATMTAKPPSDGG